MGVLVGLYFSSTMTGKSHSLSVDCELPAVPRIGETVAGPRLPLAAGEEPKDAIKALYRVTDVVHEPLAEPRVGVDCVEFPDPNPDVD